MLGTTNITVLLTSVNTMLLLYSCCTCWFTVTVVKLVIWLGNHDDDIAAITAMITVYRAQQNLNHCEKSTSSRYYRPTRLHLHVRSIVSIDRLDRFQGLGSSQTSYYYHYVDNVCSKCTKTVPSPSVCPRGSKWQQQSRIYSGGRAMRIVGCMHNDKRAA